MDTPSVIKIDGEGFEAKVLDGATRYIGVVQPWIAIDIHYDPFGEGNTTESKVRATLGNLGYQFEKMDHVLLCNPSQHR